MTQNYERIKAALDNEQYQRRLAAMNNAASLVTWLMQTVPQLYHAVRNQTEDLWSWLRRQFAW